MAYLTQSGNHTQGLAPRAQVLVRNKTFHARLWFDYSAACDMQATIDLFQFIFVLDLNAEMIKARLPATCRNGEVHSRVVKHPLSVIGFDDARLRSKQR